jgi:hypothetical protein
MSLSSWIRDYVFMPLAAQRRNWWWPYAALIVSMTLFGIWHGAKWTFVLWGVYHGVLLVLHRLGQQMKRRWTADSLAPAGEWLPWISTFSLISLGWILFRANDPAQAATMLRTVFMYEEYGRLNLPVSFYIVTPAVIVGYFVLDAFQSRLTLWKSSCRQQPGFAGYRAFAVEIDGLLRQRTAWWLAPVTAVLLVVTLIVATDSAPRVTSFIYTTF